MSLYHDDDDEDISSALADFGLHQLSAPLHRPHDDDNHSSLPTASNNRQGFVHLSPPHFTEPISDPDLFLSTLYNYYHKRGLGPIIAGGIVELVTLFFTLFLSYVVGACLDWNALGTCRDENSCSDEFFSRYWIAWGADRSRWKSAWIGVYCFLFTGYGIFCVVQFGYAVMASLESKLFMEEVLAVHDEDLEMGRVDWGEIVERMGKRSDVMGRRLGMTQFRQGAECRPGEKDATCHLVVAQRIMRRENFMIAFFNLGLLDLTLPNIVLPSWAPHVVKQWMDPARSMKRDKRIFYSKSIEWSIYFCVLNYMFNHSRKIRPAFYGDPSSLQRRFILCGVAHLLFMPFLLFFVTLHFFMVNVYDWQSTKEYLGPREWSMVAQWRFREFNELPHSFERRIEPSYKCAAAYLEMFSKPSALSVATGRLLVFISGSLGTLLLVFAAINDAILLHVKIGQWNLLWYAGVLGASFSMGKSMLPKSTSPYAGHARRNLAADMNSELERVAAHTHYFPDNWRGKGCDERTKKSFSAMFQYKAGHFAMEILSIVVAPLILCVSLPKCADGLCNFVRDSKVEVPGAGDVVGYSTFDFDMFEDDNWRGKGELSGDASGGPRHNTSEGKLDNGRPKAKHGKMENSFFNFKSVYPGWTLPPSGKILVDMVETYRKHQEMALAHERRLHIDAAEAQLVTLRRLEMERDRKASSLGLVGFVDNRHVKATSGPDTGGGGMPKKFMSDSTQSGLSSFGSFNDELHHPHVHFDESVHSFVPPTRAFTHSSMLQGASTGDPTYASVMHYTDAGLSMELRGLLDRSSLVDPSASAMFGLEQSFTGSLVPIDEMATSILDMRTDRQYLLLDRYHSDAAREQQQQSETLRDTQGELT